MDPNLQNTGQGVQQNITQPDISYQFPRMPQMQNVVGQQVNTFVPGYNVMPQAQGAVVTNLQTGLPVSGFLSLGSSNGSGPLPSMGSFIASLNQPSQQVGIVQNVGKSGVENWTGSSQNNSTLPSFGHFLLPQQYQNQPQQTLIGTQTSPQQQIFPVSQQSPQQVFSPGQHSTQFFPAAQMSPQQQMFTTNQHSPQQILVNNQPTAQFFSPTQPSQQFFGSTIQQQQVFTGQPAPQQIYTNTQPMFSPVPNRLPAGQIIGSDMLPQVMTTPRMNINTNYVAGVNNIVGVTGNQMLPPINQLMTTSTGQVLPSIGNMLHGQALPSFNNFVSPYGGHMSATGTVGNHVFLPTSVSTSQVTSSVVTTMSSNPHLVNIHGEPKLQMSRNVSQHSSHVAPVSMTTPTVSHSRSTKKAKTSPSYSNVSRVQPKSTSIEDSRTCVVPFGWSRVVVDNAIIYYSPTNVALKTPMEIAKYLTTDGSCKCGLECPVYINKVFNFDVGILSRMWTLDVDCPQDLTKLCNHKRKMMAMAAFHSNFSVSSSQLSDTVSVNSVSGGIPSASTSAKTKTDLKKTSRPTGSKSVPVGGILVSDLMKEQERKEKLGSASKVSQSMPTSITQPKSLQSDSTVCLSRNTIAQPNTTKSISHGRVSGPSGLMNITSSNVNSTSTDTLSHDLSKNNNKDSPSELEDMSVVMETNDKKQEPHQVNESEAEFTKSQNNLTMGDKSGLASDVSKLVNDAESETCKVLSMETDSVSKEEQKIVSEPSQIEMSMEQESQPSDKNQENVEVDNVKCVNKSKSDKICLSTDDVSENIETKGHDSGMDSADKGGDKVDKSEPKKDNQNDTTETKVEIKPLLDSENVSTGSESTNAIDLSTSSKTIPSSVEKDKSEELNRNESASTPLTLPNDRPGGSSLPPITNPLPSPGKTVNAALPVTSSLSVVANSSTQTLTSISSITSSLVTSLSTVTTSSNSVHVSTSSFVDSSKQVTKGENHDLKISVASTIVTSILSSINAVRSHDSSDRKKSPKSPKQHKGHSLQKSPKSPKPPGTYDSFPVFQMPRYPLSHLPPVSGSEFNPYDLNPYSGQFMTPGMFNIDPYSLLNDKWLDPKKPKKSPKSSKKENTKTKVNNVFDSDTPPPNVDVSLLQDHGKGPIPKVSPSFLDDPTAFLAEQSVLISSSLSTNLSSPTKDSHKAVGVKDKNDTVDGDLKSSPVSSTTGSRASTTLPIPFALSTASHGMVVNSSANLSKVGQSFSSKSWGDESHSILGCAESEMFTEDRCESLSPDSGYECPSANETITPSSVVHHTASNLLVEKKMESQLDKTALQNNKILDILSNARKGFLPPCTVGSTKKKISPQKGISSLQSPQPVSKTFPSRSAIQQVLSNAKSNEFPASTLLSAAARAQMANQTLNYPMISQSTQNQISYVNPIKPSNSDSVSVAPSEKTALLVSQPNIVVSSSVKSTGSVTPFTMSDIVSGHESVAKLLRQPVNLNITNSLNKGTTISKSSESAPVTSTVLSSVSKTVNSVTTIPSTSSNGQQNIPVSSVQSSFQNILPNLSALPPNLGQPLLNIVANNLGINVLPGSQVMPESAGIAQNNLQYIPVPGQSLVSVDNNQGLQGVPTGSNINQQLITKGHQSESQNLKSAVPGNDLVNIPKLQMPCLDPVQQQQSQSSNVANGQMLLMPNLQMPLLQYLGTNPVPVNMGQDKNNLQQLCNPPDLQMMNGQMQVNMPNMGAPFNVMNIQQQIWNNSGNLTAMQLHTLQLQQQLLQQIQQLQDMQSLISQFSLQGNSVPITTVANSRDDAMTTRENSVPGKATPETMVSIVSTTCQESPGNGDDGQGSSEDKGTSTDFDEDSADYVDQEMIENEFEGGGIADTTCSVSADNEESSCSQTETIVNTSISQRVDNSGAAVDNGAIDDSGVDLSVDVCHTNNEPVNFSREDNSCISSSSVETKHKHLSSSNECIPESSKSLISKVDQTADIPAVKTRKAVKELAQKRKHGEDIDDELLDSLEIKGIHDFNIGDLVWGQIRGFPSWPGKVVHESEVYDAEELEPGKCWVKWFGDHTFTQVEMQKLKTLTEGLEGHQKAKKKNKKGRKMNSNLEAAIHEALIELDRQASMMQIDKDSVAKKKKIK